MVLISALDMVEEHVSNVVRQSLDQLVISGCVRLSPNGDIDPTPMGTIMSYYYLSHFTIRNIIRQAKPSASFGEVLTWICTATEFDDLPVRHNEDLINDELSKILPLEVEMGGKSMGDPHVKAFLLLQAHFAHLELPISDYVGDQKSVLDQCIRIIRGAIDVLGELEYSESRETAETLLKCVEKGRWPEGFKA